MKNIKNILLTGILLLGNFMFSQTFVIPDTAFRTCLINKNPSAFDSNEELILSEAENIIGILTCENLKIQSVEGLQYLTGVTELFLSKNQIKEISAFPTSSNLERIVLDDNQLSQLPTLSVVPKLRTLVVKKNKLTSLPDLSPLLILRQLYVSSNRLTEIPNLNNKKDLWAVDFSDNLLTKLPVLDSLKNLKELIVDENQLTQIQSLENLSALLIVNISSNKISAFPKVAVNNIIETVDIEENDFSVLPDFSVFPKLKSGFVNDNKFTFSELIKLKNLMAYQTLFPINSQKILTIGQENNVVEGEELYLTTGIDLGVDSVLYSWYKDSLLIQSSYSDSLLVNTDSASYSGTYFCQLSKKEFPNLKLKTNTFPVVISKCFTEKEFTIKLDSRNCERNESSIEIKSGNTLPQNFHYELSSTTSDFLEQNNIGEFDNLTEYSYEIFGVVGSCKKQIDLVEIQEKDCDNVFITADGDGVDDSYYFDDKGSVLITDKFGNKITEIKIPNKWDGIGKNGFVSPGLYYAYINKGERVIKITVVH